MYDIRPITLVVGFLLCVLAVAMLIPAAIDLSVGDDDWLNFFASSAVTLFVGVALTLTSRGFEFSLKVRQAFLLVVAIWVTIPAFGALPFVFSELRLSYTDAFFESMSGITTTGSTVIVGLDAAPPGLLLWRALLQWMGGIGIIVMAFSILPMLRVGGMQLFRMESSDTADKALPRAAQIAAYVGGIYVILTVVCMFAYIVAGMGAFDALAHAMTTIATGGYSTRDLSIGAFGSAGVDYVAVVFMTMSALPFVLYLRAVRGHGRALITDGQVRTFLVIVAVAIAIMTLYLISTQPSVTAAQALRLAAFNVVSVITGTGYATSDYALWGSFALGTFFFLMFVGGCAGSTTCGIKVFRFQVLYALAKSQFRKLLAPHGMYVATFNGNPIPDSVAESVMGFFFMFVVCFVLLSLGLGFLGLDMLTAISGAATAIANVGPGLGPVIGPAGSFASLPDAAKWLLALGMLIGRLELFTVLILLSPAFWRS